MSHEQDKVVSGLISERDLGKIREAVCIQVEKIYDSCKEKDCIEDARVLFKHSHKIRWLINRAINVKCRRAEVLDVFADVEPVPFKRGFFTVDVKFFIKVTLEFFVPRDGSGIKIIPVQGIVIFDKKVILFGSEGSVKIFKSLFVEHGIDKPVGSTLQQNNLPIAKIEVAEPICLNARIAEVKEKCRGEETIDHLPRSFVEYLGDEEIVIDDIGNIENEDNDDDEKEVLVSIGLFSIIKLARFVQILVPAFNFCVPEKKCVASTEENPCEIFDTIEFPIDEFFPPQKFDFPGAEEEEKALLGEAGK